MKFGDTLMRFVWLLAPVLLLASCGQNGAKTEEAPPAAAPTVVRSYTADNFMRLNGGTVATTAEGVQIVTDPRTGAMSASVALGEEAQAEGVVVRVRGRVSEGAFQIVSTYRNFAAGYQPEVRPMPAGLETTVEIPVDRGGDPLLVISNGSRDGPSTGVISSVELVRQ